MTLANIAKWLLPKEIQFAIVAYAFVHLTSFAVSYWFRPKTVEPPKSSSSRGSEESSDTQQLIEQSESASAGDGNPQDALPQDAPLEAPQDAPRDAPPQNEASQDATQFALRANLIEVE